jgi:hypothetical protein
MRPSSKVILPYEPGYTGHWEMEKRRKETKEWLRRRFCSASSSSTG